MHNNVDFFYFGLADLLTYYYMAWKGFLLLLLLFSV